MDKGMGGGGGGGLENRTMFMDVMCIISYMINDNENEVENKK